MRLSATIFATSNTVGAILACDTVLTVFAVFAPVAALTVNAVNAVEAIRTV